MNDFYDLLARGEAFKNFLAECLLFYVTDKVFNNFKINISLKERQPYFFKGCIYVLFIDEASAFEFFENRFKFLADIIKHQSSFSIWAETLVSNSSE